MIVGSVILTGCSSFNKQWEAVRASPSSEVADITGAWEGEWKSQVNTHRGQLRAIFTRADEQTIDARFHAVYWSIFRFTSHVQLAVTKTNGVYHLEGGANLPAWAGGRYDYDGSATPTEFKCTYRSRYDNGVFELKRPEQVEPTAP
jgi:hypothetical protein